MIKRDTAASRATDDSSNAMKGLESFLSGQGDQGNPVSGHLLPNTRDNTGTSVNPSAQQQPGTEDTSLLRQERINAGQCPSCGQVLFKVKKGLFRKEHSFVPLSVAGLVDRGQCLNCCNSNSGLQDSSQSLDAVNVGLPLSTSMAAAALPSGAPAAISDDSFSSHDHEDLHFSMETLKCPTIDPTIKISTSNSTAVYSGAYNHLGERHGAGVMSWNNGDVYEGNFAHGMRHGFGTLHFHDQSEYVGEWHRDCMQGSATRRFTNGDVYVGQYVEGKRSGNDCRYYFANGDLYVGSWRNDTMNGFGRYYYSNGQRFEGRFRDGKRHGPGKVQRVDGSIDQFLYLNDQRSGVGVHWSRGRTKAWTCDIYGRIKKKLTMEEAISMVYEIENTEC